MIRNAELIRNARKPLEMNVENGDDLLIVTDTAMDPQMWTVINTAARSLGLDPSVALMSRRGAPHSNPTPQIREAILASDVCVMITSVPIVHSKVAMEAQKQKTKFIAMEDMNFGILSGGAASADYDSIVEHGRELRELWTAGERVRVTSPRGMDLEAGLEGRNGYFACGKVEDQPGVDLYVAAFPDGEAAISPVEGTSNGTIIWDVEMHGIGMLDTPIEADVEDGYVTEIRGGTEADELRRLLDETGDPDAYNLAEIAIGINPQAGIVGSMRQDKKANGYLHLAIGANADTGGTVGAPIHVDGVLANGTLEIDGETIVENGTVLR